MSTTTTTTARPLAALAGAAVCGVAIVGTLVAPADPGFAGAPDEIAASFIRDSGAILASSSLYLLSSVFVLVFAGFLRSVIARAEGGDGRIATTAFGGMVAGATLSMGGASLHAMGALRADEQGAISPEVATALHDVGMILYGLAAPMAMAVGVVACAVMAFRTGFLPTWLAGASALLGLALLIPPINYIAINVFIFWCLAVGVTLYLKAAPATTRAHSGVAVTA